MAKDITRRVSIYINGTQVENTVKSLKAALKQLQNEQAKCTIGSEEYVRKAKDIRQINTLLEEHKKHVRSMQSGWQSAIQTMSRIGNTLGGIRAFGAMIGASSQWMEQFVDQAATLDDEYAKVMKTTGLTKDQVLELNEAFKKMDTRTSREQLNELAYQAGKLGINTQETVEQFVKASDVINIALGDVLGDQAMITIGKLTNVYEKSSKLLQDKSLEDKMMAIGNAVNELGKRSTAMEDYIVDFTARLGGLANQAGLTADQVMGFASALSQNMQRVEMSATAFQKLLQNMIKKPAEFAQVAGMSIKEFTDLVGTDMNEAVMKVLQGFSGAGGFQKLIPMFKDMGLDGARAAQAISSLANNIDKITVAQQQAYDQMAGGQSMMIEYKKMNDSMEAQMEKLQKRMTDAKEELGREFYPIVVKMTQIGANAVSVMADTAKYMLNNRTVMAALLASLAAIYRQQLLNVALKAKSVALTLQENIANMKANSLEVIHNGQLRMEAINRLSVNTAQKAMLKTQTALNVVMKATPWGLVISGISAVVAAVSIHNQKLEEAKMAQKTMSDGMKEISKASNQRQMEINMEIAKTEDIIKAHGDESSMLRELNSKYGSVFGTYNSLKEWYDVLIGKSGDYVQAMYLQARVQQDIADASQIQSDIDEAKRQGPQTDGRLKRGGRMVGAFVSTFLGSVDGSNIGQAYDRAVEAFNNAAYADLDAYNTMLTAMQAEKTQKLEQAQQDQKELDDLVKNSGININGAGAGDMGNPTDYKSVDKKEIAKQLKEQKAALAAIERVTNQLENKNLNGIEQKLEAIDQQVDSVKEKATDAFGESMPEAVKKMLETLDEKAAGAKLMAIQKYIASVEKSLIKLEGKNDSTADSSLLREVENANDRLESTLEQYDETIEKLQGDVDLLNQSEDEKDKAEAKRIEGLIERYKKLRQAKINSAYVGVDTAWKGTTLGKKQGADVSADINARIDNGTGVKGWLSRTFGRRSYSKALQQNENTYNDERTELLDKIAAQQGIVAGMKSNHADQSEIDKAEAKVKELQDDLVKLGQLKLDADEIVDADAWKDALSKMASEVQTFSDALLGIWSSINQVFDNMSDTELKKVEAANEKELEQMDEDLEAGLISQEEYNEKKEKMDDEYNKKKEEEENKAFYRNQAYSAAEAGIATALAIMQVWADKELTTGMKWAQTAVVAAEGLAQQAAIWSESAPNAYAKGGYVPSATTFVAGEAGEEWVASNKLLTNPATAPVIHALEQYQRGGGLALPYSTMNVDGMQAVVAQQAEQRAENRAMLAVMTDLAKYLKDPQNRQAVISRATQERFDTNENFLRAASRL